MPVYGCVMTSPFGNIALREEGGLLKTVRRTRAREDMEKLSPVLRTAARQLELYFAGRLTRFDVPIAPDGTEFQKKIWAAVMEIPYGTRRSYSQIAAAVGHPRAARAAGTANAICDVWIIIPCHRVVSADGGLGGYGGDLRTKQRLLDHEAAYALPSFLP